MFVDLLIIICGYAEWILGGPVKTGEPVDLRHGGESGEFGIKSFT